MRIGVLHAGDKVINITNEFVAIERVNGEVDVFPFIRDIDGIWVDTKHIFTVGYGNNIMEVQTEGGVDVHTF